MARMHRFGSAAFAALLASAAAGPAAAFEVGLQISNYRQGLLRFAADGTPEIYQQGDTFPNEVNGTCVVAGVEKPCVWYGFEFDYVSPAVLTLVNCNAVFRFESDDVNPRAVLAENVTEAPFRFILSGHAGHYIRPQYTITDWKPVEGPNDLREATAELVACYDGERRLFTRPISLTHPTHPAPQRPFDDLEARMRPPPTAH